MRMNAWNVFLNGRLIDTVFFDKTCDEHWVYDSRVSELEEELEECC